MGWVLYLVTWRFHGCGFMRCTCTQCTPHRQREKACTWWCHVKWVPQPLNFNSACRGDSRKKPWWGFVSSENGCFYCISEMENHAAVLEMEIVAYQTMSLCFAIIIAQCVCSSIMECVWLYDSVGACWLWPFDLWWKSRPTINMLNKIFKLLCSMSPRRKWY